MAKTTQEQRLMSLFAGNANAHGTHGEPDWAQDQGKWTIRRTAKTIKKPVTEEIWSKHLKGEYPLGVVVIREDSTCKFMSIDVDVYDQDLTNVIKMIEDKKLPFVPVRSKSGGLHLFLFLTEPMDAGVVVPVLRDLAASLGLAKSELFPKQTRVITKRGDVGSWIIAPYFGDTYDGRLMEQVGLRRTGAALTLDQFLTAAERALVSPEQFLGLASSLSKKDAGARPRTSGRKRSTPRTNGDVTSPFADGPPCLQHLVESKGIVQGTQNNTLMMMGVYYKMKFPDTWKEELAKANQEFLTPSGSQEGLESVIRSHSSGRNYNYMCKNSPMCDHCNSSVCITRAYGVGDLGDTPRITSISKLDADPVLWFVDIDDQRLELTTPDLQNYTRFHAACMEKLNKCFSILTQKTWLEALKSAMQHVIVIEGSADVNPEEEFREMLEEFLTNRQKAASKEGILNGSPWEDEEEKRHYFRLRDLQAFMKREGERDVKRGRVTQSLKKLGGGHHFFNLQGHGTNVWWIPSHAVNRMPEPSAPPTKDTPI